MKFEMTSRTNLFFLVLTLLGIALAKVEYKVTIDGIDPESGPLSGATRVMVRGGPFRGKEKEFPRPKVNCFLLFLVQIWLI